MGCFLSRQPKPNESALHVLQFPANIRVRGQRVSAASGAHAAMLSYDEACYGNYISSELVTNFLGEEINQLVEKEDIKDAQSLPHNAINGYVDLEWCLASDMQEWHMARFLVATSASPQYDLVLGRRDAEKYGMDKARF